MEINRDMLFVCGFPGGGTDLTKTILNSHPDIYINGEMPFLYKLGNYGISKNSAFSSIEEIRSFQTILKKINTWENIENINHDFSAELAEMGEISLEDILHISFSREIRQVWGNKTPQNTEHISQLDTLFPESRFIFVIRDVRDVCLSWKNKWGKNLYWCAAKWSDRMMIGWRECQALSSKRYLFIRFEKLISESEEIIRKMCEFLGIPFSEQMLEHDKYTRGRIDGKINYGQAILSGNYEKWRTQLSSKNIRRIEEIAYESMSLFDYQIEYAKSPIPIKAQERYYAYLQDSSAILTTGNIASRDNQILARIGDLVFEFRKMMINSK